MLVSQNTSLGYLDFAGMRHTGLLHLSEAGEGCQVEEGEAPPLGVFVVALEHVGGVLAYVLPLLDGLVDPYEFGNAGA